MFKTSFILRFGFLFCTAFTIASTLTLVSAVAVVTPPDLLIVNPSYPTLSDSIRITVITPCPCCCNGNGANFNYDSSMVSIVGDSAIHIFHNIPFMICIDTTCAVCAKNYLNYKIPPMKAGNYSVYKTDMVPVTKCVGEKCTTSVYAADAIDIGKFVVSTSSKILNSPISPIFKSDKNWSMYDIRGKRLSLLSTINRKNISFIYILRTGNIYTKRVILK